MSAIVMAPATEAPAERTTPLAAPCDLKTALLGDLDDLSALLTRLEDHQYICKPVGVFESSIGGHVRHCLDHYESLLRGIESGCMNFDERRRGTPVETVRWAAINAINAIRQRINALPSIDIDAGLLLKTLPSVPGSVITVKTTVGREVVFVLSHTTHHNAIICAMAKILGVETSKRFGVAPSTIVYRDNKKCAP